MRFSSLLFVIFWCCNHSSYSATPRTSQTSKSQALVVSPQEGLCDLGAEASSSTTASSGTTSQCGSSLTRRDGIQNTLALQTMPKTHQRVIVFLSCLWTNVATVPRPHPASSSWHYAPWTEDPMTWPSTDTWTPRRGRTSQSPRGRRGASKQRPKSPRRVVETWEKGKIFWKRPATLPTLKTARAALNASAEVVAVDEEDRN